MVAALVLVAPPAAARELKLWPLFDYESDPQAGTRSLKVLGPLFEYGSDPTYRTIIMRPFLSIRQARVGHDDEVRVLYPLIVSRWGPEEQTTRGIGGLVDYRTTTTTDGKTLTGQHFRALSLYFYDWDGEHGGRASLVPVYADLENQLGYDRMRMILFPTYLRTEEENVNRRYWLYPFFGDVVGDGASGYRAWPIYGHETIGDTDEAGFVLWPFYVWSEHAAESGVERRFDSFPFYSSVRGPTRERSAYGTVLYVHARDRVAERESWGAPWPLWTYEKDTATGEPTTIRVLPFYAHRHERGFDDRTIAWPLYRHRRYEDETTVARRTDGLLVLYRDERRTDVASGEGSHLRAVFPAVVDEGDPEIDRGGSPALVDALAPRDGGIRQLYAPLWQAYGWSGRVAAPRLSIAWGAIVRERGETTWPIRFDPPDELGDPK